MEERWGSMAWRYVLGFEFAERIQTIHLTIYLALDAKGKSDSYGALVD